MNGSPHQYRRAARLYWVRACYLASTRWRGVAEVRLNTGGTPILGSPKWPDRKECRREDVADPVIHSDFASSHKWKSTARARCS